MNSPERPTTRVDTGSASRTRRSPGGAARHLLKGGAVVAVILAGAWAYHANVTAARPAMDMSMRVTAANGTFPVAIAAVEPGPVFGTATYTGSVAALNEEDIFPRVTGRLVEMPVYPGDRVQAGQVVARLDDVELGSRVQEASAGAAAAAANLAQMDADVAAARFGVTQMEKELLMAEAEVRAALDGVTQAQKELAMVEAEAEYQEQLIAREERLFASGAVSRQEVESARAMAAAARAKVGAARARTAQAEAMATAARARVEAGRAKLEQARAMEGGALRKREAMAAMAVQGQAMLRTAAVVRDYAEIRASSSGYVAKRYVAPGVLVQPGTAILKIAQIDRVRLQANVSEKDLSLLRVGSPVRVMTVGASREVVEARVSAVFPFVDPGSRTAVVEAVVENNGRRFVPGGYVTMEFVTGQNPAALSVPRAGVSRLSNRATAWVVAEDGRVELRPVTTGLEGPKRIEITGGVGAGERVVVRGHEGLYAGARVTEVAPGAAPAAPGPARAPAPVKTPGPATAPAHGGH